MGERNLLKYTVHIEYAFVYSHKSVCSWLQVTGFLAICFQPLSSTYKWNLKVKQVFSLKVNENGMIRNKITCNLYIARFPPLFRGTPPTPVLGAGGKEISVRSHLLLWGGSTAMDKVEISLQFNGCFFFKVLWNSHAYSDCLENCCTSWGSGIGLIIQIWCSLVKELSRYSTPPKKIT